MKYARFLDGAAAKWGVLEGESLVELEGPPWNPGRRGRSRPLAGARLLAPIEVGNKVVLLMGGYARGERDGPGVLVKPPSAIIGHLDRIVLPKVADRVVAEAEMALVIGKRGKGVSRGDALSHVFGCTCVNDVTATGLKTNDGRLSARFKSFDTFCPMGPYVVTGLDAGNARIWSRVNGGPKQDASTRGLAWSVEEIVAWVSGIMTLFPGDIISTATPPGPAAIAPGDVVECEVEGVGVLRNEVVAEQ